MREFRECSSQYEMEDKQDSEEISSDGEFKRAENIEVMLDNDPEVLRIQEAKAWIEKAGLNLNHVPEHVIKEANQKLKAGEKADRTKNYKHFNQVGYMGN